MLFEIQVRYLGICKNCGFKVKYGEYYSHTNLHLYCATSKDLRILRERGKKELQKNISHKGRGSHFGTNYNGFCLEY